MNNFDTKRQVEDLQLMLMHPKLFIDEYFGDLTNQLIIKILKFELEETEKTTEYCKQMNQVENWTQSMITYLDEAKAHYLSKITSSFKIDIELENRVQRVIERYHNCVEKTNDELKKELYKYYLQMKYIILDNDCFLILDEDTTNILRPTNATDSFNLWKKYLPLIKVQKGFIGEKGQKYLQ